MGILNLAVRAAKTAIEFADNVVTGVELTIADKDANIIRDAKILASTTANLAVNLTLAEIYQRSRVAKGLSRSIGVDLTIIATHTTTGFQVGSMTAELIFDLAEKGRDSKWQPVDDLYAHYHHVKDGPAEDIEFTEVKPEEGELVNEQPAQVKEDDEAEFTPVKPAVESTEA